MEDIFILRLFKTEGQFFPSLLNVRQILVFLLEKKERNRGRGRKRLSLLFVK